MIISGSDSYFKVSIGFKIRKLQFLLSYLCPVTLPGNTDVKVTSITAQNHVIHRIIYKACKTKQNRKKEFTASFVFVN
jgi:hypothetical protein